MRRVICLLLGAALALSLFACTPSPDREEGSYQLYFTALRTAGHGPAIQGQPYQGDGDPTPEALVSALLAGPTQEGLASPFPRGLSLRSLAQEDGVLSLTFSEQYGGLTDISLTLADYCLVLTLCQLEGVDAVEIAVSGQTVSYRSHQLLTPDEAVLSGKIRD